MRKMEAGFQENALSYLLVLRLIPLFPFFLVNIVPAFLGVKLRTYAIGTFIGIIPGSFVYATVGAGLGSIFDQNGRVYLTEYIDAGNHRSLGRPRGIGAAAGRL